MRNFTTLWAQQQHRHSYAVFAISIVLGHKDNRKANDQIMDDAYKLYHLCLKFVRKAFVRKDKYWKYGENE